MARFGRSPRPRLPNRFICRLRDGDVLLFDTLHPVSHMIKLADNSPVSNAAIYQESGQCIIHASADDRRERVPLAREHLQRLRELGLDHSSAAAARRATARDPTSSRC